MKTVRMLPLCIASQGLAIAALPPPAFAWGDDGHKIVGLIADHYLDPAVRTQVQSMLAGDTSGLVLGGQVPRQ